MRGDSPSLIGNDVVDLEDEETRLRALHPRFVNRVFTSEEQERIAASRAPRRALWALWAAKEASYKLLKKLDPATLFAHRAFVIQPWGKIGPDGDPVGVARYQRLRLRIQWRIRADHLHAVALSPTAADGSGEDLRWRSFHWRLRSEHSAVVRADAVGALEAWLGAPRELRIVGSRPPRLLQAGAATGVDLSLSHHGRWVAWAAARTTAASTSRTPVPS
jgi:hypothetical protein